MSTSLPEGAKPFDFTGNAKEWFGIWIVNLLLSIVTIGIYSAWAKVRTKKYFYNHTYVEGRNFDYHATGKQIFIGRLIVIAALIVFQIITVALPPLGLLLAIALIFVLPWLLVRAMIFNARMSSFSNVRFGFFGTVGEAFLMFLVYPILVALSLYTTAPILSRAVNRFVINNHKLGQAQFSMQTGLWIFYKAFLIAIAWVVVAGLIGVFAIGFNFMEFANAMENAEAAPTQMFKMMAMFYLLFFVAFLPAAFIYQALIRNAIFNNTTLEGGHRFASNVTAPKLLWLAISNMVVVVCTLFLMLPWAQVRMARYLASHTGFIPGGSMDDFVTQQQDAGGAIGDAYADIEGIDLGLAI